MLILIHLYMLEFLLFGALAHLTGQQVVQIVEFADFASPFAIFDHFGGVITNYIVYTIVIRVILNQAC